MSFNRIISHSAAGYIEIVFDGYEDWMSAAQTIEQVGDLIDDLGVRRILLDFSCVDMRLAVAEAPTVANLFHAFAIHPMNFGIIRSGDARGDATIEAFAAAMRVLGHGTDFLESGARVDEWVGSPKDFARRAG